MSERPGPGQIRDLIPFAVLVGVELLDADPERVRGRLDYSPQRCTAGGILHGGALITLADTCGGACAVLNLPEGAIGTATIESKANFLRAARGGPVIATTHPIHRGRTIAVFETELEDEDGSLLAKVTQTQIFHYPD